MVVVMNFVCWLGSDLDALAVLCKAKQRRRRSREDASGCLERA